MVDNRTPVIVANVVINRPRTFKQFSLIYFNISRLFSQIINSPVLLKSTVLTDNTRVAKSRRRDRTTKILEVKK